MQAFCLPKNFLLVLVLLLAHCITAAAAPMSTENGKEILVLNYHKIDSMDDPLSIAPEDFDAQMKHLKENSYHSITADQLCDYLEKGTPLPTRPLLITFDDGYSDNYHNAYPILKKYGFGATIFVIANDMGKRGYLTWQQAKEMSRNGISIQSHTSNHRPLSKLSNSQAAKELKESRQLIQEKIGQPVQYIAYPEGSYNRLIKQLTEKAGYRGGFSIRYGTVDSASDRFNLERIAIFRTSDTFRDFLRRIHYASNYEQYGWIEP